MGLPWGFNANKLKTNCKLGISRIKLLRNKKQLALKALRKEVAGLLSAGKSGNARIRVESVIRETLLLQAFDTLEVYLELLAVRTELLSKTKEMPPDMMEAICSIIYASQRISGDLPELTTLRTMLANKYSGLYKDFAVAAASDTHYREWQVNETLAGCLSVEAPSPEQKIAVLESISAESGAPFDAGAARAEMGQSFVVPPSRPTPGAPAHSTASSSTQGGGVTLQPSWGATQFAAALDNQAPPEGDDGLWRPAAPSFPAEPQKAAPPTALGATNVGPAQFPASTEYGDQAAALAAAAKFRALAEAAELAAARFGGDSNAGDSNAGGSSNGGDNSGGNAAVKPVTPQKPGTVSPATDPMPPRFVERSESEVQRSYDEAPSYPTKPGLHTESSAPSAPSAAMLNGAAAPPSPTPDSGAATRPQGPPPVGPDDRDGLAELEDLTQRFEALKKR